ncbi:MAG TPA: hypothetical protein VJ673_04115, partial [Aromatoleum sp.]|uniref:hypothetical protein n=1 Tax=Aromatoleum sp. TaxID=2307007 RepID=UPI002B47F86F
KLGRLSFDKNVKRPSGAAENLQNRQLPPSRAAAGERRGRMRLPDPGGRIGPELSQEYAQLAVDQISGANFSHLENIVLAFKMLCIWA